MKIFFLRVVIGIGLLILILFFGVFFSIASARKDPPPLLAANVTELDKIQRISKYRSCAGHVTVPQDNRETRRNMKHYFWVKPEYNKPKTVEIYAPYDGYVADMRSDAAENLEGEIWISQKKIFFLVPPVGVWAFSVQHIDIRPDLKLGDAVKAGELIGWLATSKARGDSFDIVYARSRIPTKRIDNWTDPFADLDSIFNHMSDGAFAEYEKLGISSRDAFITSKQERDRNLCEYSGEGPYFTDQENPENWVMFP
ncbi:MAG: hypothetical protein Q7T01_04760 [bacterium]|nr:hypothetical protein [bacterium]